MRLLFLRFGSIGNAVVSIPTIRAVRQEKPDAYLALLCNPATFDLWKDCPWLDKVMVYDQKNLNKPGPGYLKMIVELRRLRFTHSIHFRRFIRSELIGFLAGAGMRIGYDPGGLSLLSKKIPYSENEHLIDQNLRLVRELGIKAEDRSLEYWPPELSVLQKNMLAQVKPPVVAIHPFAHTQRANRWKKFPELAEKLQKELGATIILVGASSEEAIFNKEWPSPGAVRTAFDLPLSKLAALLKAANLFIGSDSGPLHLATAVGTPSISIYTPRPDLASHLKKWMPSSPRFKAVMPPANSNAEISVDEVLSSARDLLAQSH